VVDLALLVAVKVASLEASWYQWFWLHWEQWISGFAGSKLVAEQFALLPL
jgi:hypothetical protein